MTFAALAAAAHESGGTTKRRAGTKRFGGQGRTCIVIMSCVLMRIYQQLLVLLVWGLVGCVEAVRRSFSIRTRWPVAISIAVGEARLTRRIGEEEGEKPERREEEEEEEEGEQRQGGRESAKRATDL